MDQRIGCPGKSRKLALAPGQSMREEADGEEGRQEALEKRDQQLQSLHGAADLNNEAIGLYNIGLSCCLNSLLQVFFMNTHFTRILRRIRVPKREAEQSNNVPYHMLLLLEKMQRSKESAVYPQELVRCLAKNQLKLFVQHDAAQLFLLLWNLIKNQITDSQLAERLSALYTIQMQEYLLCQKCSFETRRSSKMLTLPLRVLDHSSRPLRTLEESLSCFFQPEQLTDDNMCLCEQCGEKTPCLQGMRLMYLPQTLNLHLNRCYFRKSPCAEKISCSLLFPQSRGLSRFLTEGTQKISCPFPFPQSLDFSEILTEEQCHSDAKEKVDWQYELFAVVAHSGSANYGHYCAYIRSLRDSKWYCFNDSSVCEVSWDDVKCTYGNFQSYWGETAYLLVYMRKNPQ